MFHWLYYIMSDFLCHHKLGYFFRKKKWHIENCNWWQIKCNGIFIPSNEPSTSHHLCVVSIDLWGFGLKPIFITNEIMSYEILIDHEPCVPDKCPLNEFPDVYFLYTLIFWSNSSDAHPLIIVSKALKWKIVHQKTNL